MFLKRIRPFRSRGLSGRLAFSYFCFFALSSVLMFGVLFFSVSDFLEQKDHDIIEVRFQQYQEMFEKDGIAGLKQTLLNPKLRTQSARFLIQLKDPLRNPVFLHLPEEIENFNIPDIERVLGEQKVSAKPFWFFIASKDGDEDAMEVRSVQLDNGYSLSVGSRTDSRDEILEKIQAIFMFLLVPLLIVAIFGAFYIAKKALRPIRELIGTASKIKDGDLSSRVPLHESHDELYELSLLFNEMVERVEGLVNAMKDTLDNVAHDLKTPITRLKIAGELALRSKDEVQARMALTESIENCEEILNLIKTIMTVSEISTKTAHLNFVEFDLNTLIDEVIDVYFFVAEEKNIKIVFPKDEQGIFIKADRSLLKQAIANLTDNAIKYSAPGSEVVINIHKNECIVIDISDHGIGISNEDLPRIWERLFRGDKSRHEPGLGLGLSLVKAIVEAHRGQIEVDSQVGVGTVFHVFLPL